MFLRIYISNNFSGNIDAAGPRTALWESPNWAKDWKAKASWCTCNVPGASMNLAVSHHRIKGQNGRSKVKETGWRFSGCEGKVLTTQALQDKLESSDFI